MATLIIKEEKAKELYPTASAEMKAIFEETYGKKTFFQKITDRVKTFNDACEVLGVDSGTTISMSSTDPIISNEMKAAQAFIKLTIIAKALNEGWTPDWENTDEYKYWPYFKMKSGFGFSGTYYAYWGTLTHVGSRLCFKTEELAKYAATQFESIYQDFLTL